MTVEETIRETQTMLNNINVPVWLTDQIANPVKYAVSNLQLCLEAFERQRVEQENAKKQTEENAEEQAIDNVPDTEEQEDPEVVEMEEVGNA